VKNTSLNYETDIRTQGAAITQEIFHKVNRIVTANLPQKNQV